MSARRLAVLWLLAPCAVVALALVPVGWSRGFADPLVIIPAVVLLAWVVVLGPLLLGCIFLLKVIAEWMDRRFPPWAKTLVMGLALFAGPSSSSGASSGSGSFGGGGAGGDW